MGQNALQITLASTAPIPAGGKVFFTTTEYLAGSISYSDATGDITLTETGRYLMNWWMATQSSVSQNGTAFAFSSSQGDLLEGNSPAKTDEVFCVGIIDVSVAPVTVSLMNISTGTIYLSSQVPLQGTLGLHPGQRERGNRPRRARRRSGRNRSDGLHSPEN